MREQRHRDHAVIADKKRELHELLLAEQLTRSLVGRIAHLVIFEELAAVKVRVYAPRGARPARPPRAAVQD